MSAFHDLLNPKKEFFNPVCPSVIVVLYEYDNSRNNYQI